MQAERCKTPEDFPVRDKGRSRLTNPPFITVAGELDMTKHRQRCQIPFKLMPPPSNSLRLRARPSPVFMQLNFVL